MQREEEAELVRRVAQGDRAAFRVLVELHQRPLSRFVRRMLSDPDASNDIVQETFLRLWTRADKYNSDAAKLTTWLHNIAHNLCIDSFRKLGRMPVAQADEDSESREPGPEDLRDAQETGERVRRAIDALPERQRSALLMCHYQGLSNRDAAAILDVSVDALESLLARGRRRLKKELNVHDHC